MEICQPTVSRVRKQYVREGLDAALDRHTPRRAYVRKIDVRYPDPERIVLVMDNLNTHSLASIYEAFAPDEAKCLVDKVEIHHTPKHGVWLNMAEIELSVLSRTCLDRRTADVTTLEAEVAAWQDRRNAAATTVDWLFTSYDTRVKLKLLYPSLHQ